MHPDPAEWLWLEPGERLALDELSRLCGLTRDELAELVEYGALVPVSAGETRFAAEWVLPLRRAGRLRADFDLDLFTVGLLLGYLRRIDALEHELRALRAHMPRHLQEHAPSPGPWREPHGKVRG